MTKALISMFDGRNCPKQIYLGSCKISNKGKNEVLEILASNGHKDVVVDFEEHYDYFAYNSLLGY